jgi:hypothetical protein
MAATLATRFALAEFAWRELDGVTDRCQGSGPGLADRGHCRPPDARCSGGSPSNGSKNIIRELD